MRRTPLARFVIALACLASCALPACAADYQVHLVDPPITNHIVLRDDPLPPVCRPLADVALHGCRSQTLPVSFVVTTSKPLEQVRIEVDQVRSESRVWPADAVDVHVVKDFYRNTIFGHMAAMPSLLVHDESFLAIEPEPSEKHPNRIANVAKGPMRDAESLRPVNIAKRKQFWVTVHIPAKAKPGDYETKLRIVPANAEATCS